MRILIGMVLALGVAGQVWAQETATDDTVMLDRRDPAEAPTPQPQPQPEGELLLEIPGYMAPVVQVGCVPLSEVTQDHSPSDLALGLASCLTDENYAYAADLYVLIGVRAYFDALRVTDPTAHEAGQVLQRIVTAHMNAEQRDGFRAALADLGGTGSDWHSGFCAQLTDWGPPDHNPSYMVFHGKMDFIAQGLPTLLPDFDADAAWAHVLTGYMGCPAP